MEKPVFFETDCDSILSQITHQEKQLKLKRRWLLELSTSESDHVSSGRSEFLNHGYLSESLLREDDIFYETVKSYVEEAFGFSEEEKGSNVVQNNEQTSSCAPNVVRLLEKRLDALSNKGLNLIAKILTGGSIEFEKTRQKMKEIIRNSLRGFRNKKHDDSRREILGQLSQVLNDPRNFRENFKNLSPTNQSRRDAAAKVLDELGSLPFQTLVAMKRKLKCGRTIPQLNSRKSGQSRNHLIKQVRNAGKKMLLELGTEDLLQEPLAKAMALADLSLKLSPGYLKSPPGDFYQFSPEIQDLQNEIVKAIWLLKTKVRFPELKTLKLLLDPEADIPNGCLRTAIKKMLTEYLFECSDLDTIPNSLLQALAVVNRSSRSVEHKIFPKEAVEEEIESILSVSAQMKQIAWHWLPDYEFDQDFSDAYMEELEESDDGNSDDDFSHIHGEDDNSCQKPEPRAQESVAHLFDSDYEESIAECIPIESGASTCPSSGNPLHFTVNGRETNDFAETAQSKCIPRVLSTPLNATPVCKESRPVSGINNTSNFEVKRERDEVGNNMEMDSENQLRSRSCFSTRCTKFDSNKPDKLRNQNQYLAIQEVCDETSMVAYNLIGRLLEKFVEEKGVELDCDDRLYLEGRSAFEENNTVEEKKQTSYWEESNGSTLVGVAKELMPCLQKSTLARLKELMDVC